MIYCHYHTTKITLNCSSYCSSYVAGYPLVLTVSSNAVVSRVGQTREDMITIIRRLSRVPRALSVHVIFIQNKLNMFLNGIKLYVTLLCFLDKLNIYLLNWSPTCEELVSTFPTQPFNLSAELSDTSGSTLYIGCYYIKYARLTISFLWRLNCRYSTSK